MSAQPSGGGGWRRLSVEVVERSLSALAEGVQDYDLDYDSGPAGGGRAYVVLLRYLSYFWRGQQLERGDFEVEWYDLGDYRLFSIKAKRRGLARRLAELAVESYLPPEYSMAFEAPRGRLARAWSRTLKSLGRLLGVEIDVSGVDASAAAEWRQPSYLAPRSPLLRELMRVTRSLFIIFGLDRDTGELFARPVSPPLLPLLNYLKAGGLLREAEGDGLVRALLGFDLHLWEYESTGGWAGARVRVQGDVVVRLVDAGGLRGDPALMVRELAGSIKDGVIAEAVADKARVFIGELVGELLRLSRQAGSLRRELLDFRCAKDERSGKTLPDDVLCEEACKAQSLLSRRIVLASVANALRRVYGVERVVTAGGGDCSSVGGGGQHVLYVRVRGHEHAWPPRCMGFPVRFRLYSLACGPGGARRRRVGDLVEALLARMRVPDVLAAGVEPEWWSSLDGRDTVTFIELRGLRGLLASAAEYLDLRDGEAVRAVVEGVLEGRTARGGPVEEGVLRAYGRYLGRLLGYPGLRAARARIELEAPEIHRVEFEGLILGMPDFDFTVFNLRDLTTEWNVDKALGLSLYWSGRRGVGHPLRLITEEGLESLANSTSLAARFLADDILRAYGRLRRLVAKAGGAEAAAVTPAEVFYAAFKAAADGLGVEGAVDALKAVSRIVLARNELLVYARDGVIVFRHSEHGETAFRAPGPLLAAVTSLN